MARVLITEDSPTTRELLVEVLGSDPEIEVVGAAADGYEAVRMAEELEPNVITMDIRMPGINGFQTTKEIMIRAPTPVVILSTHIQTRDVRRCMDAFRAGALTILPQIPDPDSPDFDEAVAQLLHTVKDASRAKVPRYWRYVRFPDAGKGVRLVATMVSNADAEALATILARLPEDFSAPVLVAQHVGHGFVDAFTTWLAANCSLEVRIPKNGEPLSVGTVYVAPEDLHMGVSMVGTPAIALSDDPPIRGFRPSGLWLFQSVAESYGSTALALVPTGVQEDTLLGLCGLSLEGAKVIAVEPEKLHGFRSPLADVTTALANDVLPPDEAASVLITAAQVTEPETEEGETQGGGPPCPGFRYATD